MATSEVISRTGHQALVWTPASVCTLVVGLRIFLRLKLRNIGAEDYFMLAAWTFLILAAGLTQANIDAVDNTVYDSVRISTQGIYNSLSCVLCLTCGKTSVGLLLHRVFGPTSRCRRLLIIGSIIVLFVLTFAEIPAEFLGACDYNDPDPSALSSCLDPTAAEGLVQSWNFYSAFVDILYSALPITFLYRLRISKRKKVGIAVLLGLGWTASVFTILRAVDGYAWGDDPNTAYFVHLLADYMEPSLVIICGSLATLVPLSEYWPADGIRTWRRSRARDSYEPTLVNSDKSCKSDDPFRPHHRDDKLHSATVVSDPTSSHLSSSSADFSARRRSVDELLPAIRVDQRFSVKVTSDHIV